MPRPVNPDAGPGSAQLRALRRQFDESFAAPEAERGDEGLQLLAVRAGGQAFALRLSDLTGVAAGRRVVPLPGDASRVLGLVGIRGQLVPVLDLAGILGLPAGEEPGWVALVGSSPPVGLALDRVDAFARCDHADVLPATGGNPLVQAAVRVGGALLPLLDLPRLTREALSADPSHPRPPESPHV